MIEHLARGMSLGKKERKRVGEGREREGEVRNEDHVGEGILIGFVRSRRTIGIPGDRGDRTAPAVPFGACCAPKLEDNAKKDYCCPLLASVGGPSCLHPLVADRDGSQAGRHGGVRTLHHRFIGWTSVSKRVSRTGPGHFHKTQIWVSGEVKGRSEPALRSSSRAPFKQGMPLSKLPGINLVTVRDGGKTPIKPAVRKQIGSLFRTPFVAHLGMSSSE